MKLIKNELLNNQKYIILSNIFLLIYIFCIALCIHFFIIIKPYKFITSLGTSTLLITEITLIFTIFLFTHKKSINNTKKNMFIIKLILIFIEYVSLIATSFITLIITNILILKEYINLSHIIIIILANSTLLFYLTSITSLLTILMKSFKKSIATVLSFQYMCPFLAILFRYLTTPYNLLKWNPFNCIFVQTQINDPNFYILTKLSLVQLIIITIIYSIIFFSLSYYLIIKNIKYRRRISYD